MRQLGGTGAEPLGRYLDGVAQGAAGTMVELLRFRAWGTRGIRLNGCKMPEAARSCAQGHWERKVQAVGVFLDERYR